MIPDIEKVVDEALKRIEEEKEDDGLLIPRESD